MTSPRPTQPSLTRLALLLAGALSGGRVLLAMPLTWPPFDTSLLEWWDITGTAGATASLLRAVGLLLTAWLASTAAIGITAALTRSAAASVLWQRFTPTSVQRAVAASAVALVASAPSIAVAAAEVDDAPMLVDLGPAAERVADIPPLLIDLGPAAFDTDSDPIPQRDPQSVESTPDTSAVTARWVVESGDHLWGIAAETLGDRGKSTTEGAVAHYWRRLISENQDIIRDVDLIHPGLVLQLPE